MKPRELATLRLATRDYSASEMRAYLVRKGVDENEAASTVAELVAEGVISDERYAQVVARDQARRGKGPAYVLAKLRQKGVRADLPETRRIYDEAGGRDEEEAVRSLLERRYPRADGDAAERDRAYRALRRRGFAREVVARCLYGPGLAPPDDDVDDDAGDDPESLA